MLVLISDLHLTDGSCGGSPPVGACELLVERIADLAVRASWRASGIYQPLERVDLVLLGDTLDLLQSTRWLQSQRVRPWSNLQSAEGAALLLALVGDVVRHNEPALALVRACAPGRGLAVPPADRQGRPAANAPPQAVPVHLHYAVGEHDWPLHLPGPGFDALRQVVSRHFGLSSRTDMPFPHELTEDECLGEVLGRHRVVARHGDQFDPFSFSGRRDQPSLTDALTIELLMPFIEQVQRELASELPAALATGLAELPHLQPLLLMPVWLEALLDRSCPAAALRDKIRRQWDQAADRLLALDIVRNGDLAGLENLATGLAGLIRFSRRPTGNWSAAIHDWWRQIGGCPGSLAARAMAEYDFRNRRAKYVVYGHTHETETVALEASSAGSFSLQQIYFNAGTWQRVQRPTQLAFGRQEFIASESFGLVAIYQGDERSGRGYETWSGSLGVQPAQILRRLDPARKASVAQPHSAPSASTVPGHGPHFAASAVWTASPASLPTL